MTHQQQTAFENIVGKGEIDCYKQFLLLPQCLLLNLVIVSLCVHLFDIISLFASELEEPKIGISGEGLINSCFPVRFLDDRLFATCSDDTNVALWDARYLKHHVQVFRGHSNWVKNIEYDSNQGMLLTSGFDGCIYTWNINRFVFLVPLKVKVRRGSVVKCLTPNAGVLGSSRTGSSGFFCGSVLGQDTSEPSLVLEKPRKA